MSALFAARACARGAGAPGCNFNVRLCNGRRRKAIVLHRSASFAYVATRILSSWIPRFKDAQRRSTFHSMQFLGCKSSEERENFVIFLLCESLFRKHIRRGPLAKWAPARCRCPSHAHVCWTAQSLRWHAGHHLGLAMGAMLHVKRNHVAPFPMS